MCRKRAWRSTVRWHPGRRCHSARTLDLIGLAAGSGTLVRIGADSAACWSVGSGNGRCRRRTAFGRVVTVTSLMQLIGEFVLGLLEFFDRLTKTASELRQFLGAKENEDNDKNDEQVWAAKVHETGEETHIQRNTQTHWPNLQGNLGTRFIGRLCSAS